jgi:hypothetical protein
METRPVTDAVLRQELDVAMRVFGEAWAMLHNAEHDGR